MPARPAILLGRSDDASEATVQRPGMSATRMTWQLEPGPLL